MMWSWRGGLPLHMDPRELCCLEYVVTCQIEVGGKGPDKERPNICCCCSICLFHALSCHRPFSCLPWICVCFLFVSLCFTAHRQSGSFRADHWHAIVKCSPLHSPPSPTTYIKVAFLQGVSRLTHNCFIISC